MGFDLVWFGILFVINMEMAYLTPPVGENLFVLKAVAPEGTTMWDIYSSVTPFILIMAVALALIMIFPEIVLWLPDLAYGVP
jgi:TRAP-type mannitol/chloroaromatic compound transport system permease large subunit